MEVFSGIIISKKVTGNGFWYSIFSESGTHNFFSRKEYLSLFEKCEVVVDKKNSTFFLSDFHAFTEISPLKKNPANLIAASWLSNLVCSFSNHDRDELQFVQECHDALLDDFSIDNLNKLENDYLAVSGFGNHDEHEAVIYDCFPYSKKLRTSLINQLSKKRLKNV